AGDGATWSRGLHDAAKPFDRAADDVYDRLARGDSHPVGDVDDTVGGTGGEAAHVCADLAGRPGPSPNGAPGDRSYLGPDVASSRERCRRRTRKRAQDVARDLRGERKLHAEVRSR